MRSRLAILLFCLTAFCIVFARQEWKRNIYTYDSFGYYVYLPAAFIYHDLGDLGFFPEINKKYNAFADSGKFTFGDCPGGKKNDKYAIGTALFELPLFLVAHMYCTLGGDVADGFTAPYQLAGIFSCIIWAVIGLFVLRKFLLGYFNDSVVAVTLLCIAIGTNLFYYTTLNQGLSHPFSFFLFASILFYTNAWYKGFNTKYLICLSLLLALALVTRPVNFVIVLIPLFWGVHNPPSLRERIDTLWIYRSKIVLAILICLPIVFLQLAYWRYTSGHWIYFSYKGEGFNFLHPKIFRGLFSYRKGWFVYTPIAFLGVIGFIPLWKKNKALVPSLVVFFTLLIYIVFSWKNWWYGGGFGCRPLIEALAVLSMPFAALLEAVLSLRKKLLTTMLYLSLAFFISLNIFQTWQFAMSIIHHDRMSRAYYWHVFGKTSINPDDYEKYLIDEKEYWRELNGVSK